MIALLIGASLCGTASAEPGDGLQVYGDDVPVYDAPRQSAGVLLRLSRGHALTEFEHRGSWVRVAVVGIQLPGQEAWMQDSSVRPVGSASPRAVPSSGVEDLEAADDGELFGPQKGSLLLDISGSAPRYRADCRLVGTGSGSRQGVFVGATPDRLAFSADTVSCHVRNAASSGDLRARLTVNHMLVASVETTLPFGVVLIRSSGRWGPACGVRLSSRARTFLVPRRMSRRFSAFGTTPVPAFERSPVPAFQRSPVPPFVSSPVPAFSSGPIRDPF